MAAAFAALTCACGGGATADRQPQASRSVPQSDTEIADLLYTDRERTPPGFYTEAPPASSYTATFHIRNSDIAALASPSDPTFELCTDDWNEALRWSETVATAAAVYSDLVATDSNEHYYEFVRVPRSTALGPEQMRVYRCAFVDRAGADLRRTTGDAGHLNTRPIADSDLQWIVEYLWRFSRYNNVDNIVLKSAAVADAGSPTHELTLAQLTRSAGGAGCDRVRVFAWRYQADAASGLLTSELTDLWQFDARNESGTTRLCGG
jgi:hypothetical protein